MIGSGHLSSKPQIVLDLSRLLSRVMHPTPTGVDRCEMAYARGLLATVPDQLAFAAVHPTGLYGRLPHDAVVRFLDATEERWTHFGSATKWKTRRFAAEMLSALWPRLSPARPKRSDNTFYVQASPNNLDKPDLIRSILKRERARLICLVHDLIPLEFPEYARQDGAAKHAVRIGTVVDHAAGIVTNSAATLSSLQPWIARSGRAPITKVAHLGTHIPTTLDQIASSERPTFVCVGTIEPRKNHLLLLNLWRRFAQERGPSNIPKLVVVGRRGWENEQIVDMLERCPALQDCVEERGRVTDSEAIALIAGAQALLMPSFAEGYGMPVTEALTLGVPVVCSDLPALREAGGRVPLYLDPLDGPGWARAIDDLALPASPLGLAQQARRSDWQAPTWSEHIAILLNMMHELDS
jgi:glycosyltransferase involved in cell wall biosynthesis